MIKRKPGRPKKSETNKTANFETGLRTDCLVDIRNFMRTIEGFQRVYDAKIREDIFGHFGIKVKKEYTVFIYAYKNTIVVGIRSEDETAFYYNWMVYNMETNQKENELKGMVAFENIWDKDRIYDEDNISRESHIREYITSRY